MTRICGIKITSDQRQKFRIWSEELNKLDENTKIEEGKAWIDAAMAILKESNEEN